MAPEVSPLENHRRIVTGIVLSVATARLVASDEAVEMVARIIAPSSWRVMDGYLADTKRKYKGENAAYDPESFKHKESMETARRVLSAIRAAAMEGV